MLFYLFLPPWDPENPASKKLFEYSTFFLESLTCLSHLRLILPSPSPIPKVCEVALNKLHAYTSQAAASSQRERREGRDQEAEGSAAPLSTQEAKRLCYLVALGMACCGRADALVATVKEAARYAASCTPKAAARGQR